MSEDLFKIKTGAPQVPENFPKVLWEGIIVKKAKLEIEDKLFIPETSKTPSNEGWIMAVGEKVKSELKVGMRVIFNKLANLFFVHEEEVYLAIHENDVFGRVEKIDDVDTPLPLNKNVFIRKGQEEIKLPSGIYLPDSQKQINYGYIVSTGENARKDLLPGMKVLYNFYENSSFLFRNREIFYMPDISIYVIVNNSDYCGTFSHGRERRPDIPFDQLPEKEPQQVVKGTLFHEAPKKDKDV